MLFNSVNFAIFFPIVFFIYWVVLKKNLKWQNIFLMLASYVFYACWDWRFVFLLAFSTFLDFICGLKIFDATTHQKKKLWLLICTLVNIGFLGFFKYYNFFIDSFQEFLQLFGLTPHLHTLQIILPVGISFYTFHGLSYVLDIYYGRIKPTRNIVDYSLFVSFFPLLVAGPIERATHLLPQVERPRTFSYSKAKDGVKQILWGLFKKVVIADGTAEFVDLAFDNTSDYSGWVLLVGAILFAFQIYGDFSGYTDIALGVARLLGFELLQNFKFPYFSRDIAEFWRRWHISLSSWFKDYLYIPLGGSKKGLPTTIRNTFIIFLVSGFWHGANWTFLAWGGLHALYMMPLVIWRKNRQHIAVVAQGKCLPSFVDMGQMLLTFTLVVLAWVFFRAESMHHAFFYLSRIPESFFATSPLIVPSIKIKMIVYALMVCFMLLIEWKGREDRHALENLGNNWSRFFRLTFYYLIVIFLFLFAGGGQNFIYFQF